MKENLKALIIDFIKWEKTSYAQFKNPNKKLMVAADRKKAWVQIRVYKILSL